MQAGEHGGLLPPAPHGPELSRVAPHAHPAAVEAFPAIRVPAPR